MPGDALAEFWKLASVHRPVVGAGDAAWWPEGALAQLTGLGLLTPVKHARSVPCDACHDGHSAEVVFIDSVPPRAYLCCPVAGRVEVPAERLRQWAPNFLRLADLVADALGLAGGVQEVVPSRAWVLGLGNVLGEQRLVVMAVGLGRPDGQAVFDKVARPNSLPPVLILVPESITLPLAYPAAVKVANLPTLVRVEGGRLVAATTALAGPKPSRRAKPRTAAVGFPTPSGADWKDVTLTLTGNRLRVQVATTRREYDFDAAGFEDNRARGKPNRQWSILKAFATGGGTLTVADAEQADNVKQQISQLGKTLRGILHIDGTPFKKVRRESAYTSAVRIVCHDTVSFVSPAGATWDDVTITEVAAGRVRVEVETGGKVATRELDLRDLGLLGSTGKPRVVGRTLLDVLRAGGRFAAPDTDVGMLDLGKYLTELLGIDGPPFAYSTTARTWMAVFEAVSERNGN